MAQKSVPQGPVYYVIVVHGIGEQRFNSTLTPVINRFAQVRLKQAQPKRESFRDVVSLGMVTGQMGYPSKKPGGTTFCGNRAWAEFENIRSDGRKINTFEGLPSDSGENIRFVELYWADILNEGFEQSGQGLEAWTNAILGRFENRQKPEDNWFIQVLDQVRITLIFLSRMLQIQAPGIRRLIFDKFLGDVQIYGENAQVRAKAIARFHNLMEKIERQHYEQEGKTSKRPPRYIIIGHSLGSVLALDALVYAHMRRRISRDSLPPALANSLPAHREYQEEYRDQQNVNQPTQNTEIYGEDWIGRVASLVTLGSPIDKFLQIWPPNFRFWGQKDHPSTELDAIFEHRNTPIRHYNYCDEQDPVGNALDVLPHMPAYQRFFSLQEDVMFSRYKVPGAAHNEYWQDEALFERLIHYTIDRDHYPEDKPQNPPEWNPGILHYSQLAFTSYFMLPLISMGITSVLLILGWYLSESSYWILSIALALVIVEITYIFRRMSSLSIWWRQMMRLRMREPQETYHQVHTRILWLLIWGGYALLLLLDAYYLPGNLVKYYEGHPFSYYAHQTFYITSLLLIGALVYLLQPKVFGQASVSLKSNFWMRPEIHTFLLYGFILLGIIALSHATWYRTYFLLPDYFYRDIFSLILLNGTLTWTFLITYFYDVDRQVRLILKGFQKMKEASEESINTAELSSSNLSTSS